MTVVFKLDDGTEVSVKPESLTLANANAQQVGLGYKVGQQSVSVVFFNAQLATADELKARAVAQASADAVSDQSTGAAQQAAN